MVVMRLVYSFLLVGVTIVWGWTFVVVQDAIDVYGVLGFLAVRFGLGAAALAPVLASPARVSRRTLLVGGGIGVVLALAYLFQTLGLLYTTPTNAGLITGLFVVFAPLTDRLFFGVRPSRQVTIAVALSVAGLVLLAGYSPSGIPVGDVLMLLCALFLGIHIVLLSHYAGDYDALGLAAAQMLSMAALFFVVWPVFGEVSLPPAGVWFALLLTGLVASAGAFYVQTYVQQRIPAARTAVILTLEPVFAALFGYWLAGDRLLAVQLVGATLILSGLLIGEVLPLIRRKPSGKVKA